MPVSPPPQGPRTAVRPKKDGTPAKTGQAIEQQTMKPVDFGKAIGIDKPANVRDKIRKWQTDLEGDDSAASPTAASPTAASPTAASPTAASPSAASPKPQLATPVARPDEEKERASLIHIPTPKKTAEPESSPERPKSAKKPVHNKLDEEVQIATAPKKRVISDSHWRNKAAAAAGKPSPKVGTTRSSPKPLPNAWVRPRPAPKPAEPKVVKPAEPKVKPAEPKVKPAEPKAINPKPIVFLAKNTGRTRSARKRRGSRPQSSGNDERERPSSSGSGSGPGEKAGDEGFTSPASPTASTDKLEPTRRRRRRRSPRTSPRGSLSAEDIAAIKKTSTHKSETDLSHDPAHVVTVEYDSEPSKPSSKRDDDIRERRRSRPKREHTRNAPSGPREPPAVTAFRPKSRRISYHEGLEISDAVQTPDPPALETPPKAVGNRLEAWLQATPDPFIDVESQKRRSSKESISTLESARKTEISDISASTDSKDGPADEAPERSSNSRRRRRERSSTIKVEPQDLDDRPSTAASTEISDAPTVEKDVEISPSLTLKRRGASSRRKPYSPTKDRALSSPLRESTTIEDDVASSAPSSSVDASTTMELAKISLRPRPETFATRRMFPSTGKRLSTIVSVETFATKMQGTPSSIMEESEVIETSVEPNNINEEVPASEADDHFNLDTLTTLSRKSTKRSKLASHADLISVLSLPRAGTKSIVSARSIRTNRSRLATATIDDIMSELAADETKYMRELRTLVDGVIPVLLSCVLSKSDSALAAGLFSRSAQTDSTNVTKPIIDMGVSLERLKSLHRRVPKDNFGQFISWAQSAQRVYSDYINAWRLGFQDVVVSLAPADEDPFTPAKVVNGPDDAAPWDEGLPQNAEGYVVNGDGERVDVAYMLKRPLVRLKYLAKSVKGINHIKPSEQAEKVANAFQDLVAAARKRSNDEYARLEDEAASNIDPTRARDPRSLAPLKGVRIDPTRCVRARDHFDMHLLHSSGQEVNCRVELLLRDDALNTGNGGDILICEVDGTGRWLFLPPVQQGHISARNGDLEGEIIVMIRGYHAGGKEWREVFSLTSEDEGAGFEWVQMLGLQPVPPHLSELKREQSLLVKPRPTSSHASSSLVSAATASTTPLKSRTPSPHEIEVPIGEQANSTSKRWSYDTPDRKSKSRTVSPVTPPGDFASNLGKSELSATSPPSPVQARAQGDHSTSDALSRLTSHDHSENERTPRNVEEAINRADNASPISLKRTKAKRLSKNPPSPTTSRSSRQIVLYDPPEETPPRKLSKRRRSEQPQSTTPSSLSQLSKGFSVWIPTSSELEYSDDSESDDENTTVTELHQSPTRPQMHRRASSVPSLDLPTIPKIRKSSQPTTPVQEPLAQSLDLPEPPASAPAKLQKKNHKATKDVIDLAEDSGAPPPVPPHRSPSPATPVTLKGSKTPVFTPSLPGYKTRRRSSSPLKHEYEPSTCSESSSESEEEISESEDISVTSESSEDDLEDDLEDDVPTPLMPIGQIINPQKVSPPSSIYTLPNGTITPSQSASNTPYRAVPQGAGQASKSVASVFSWSDIGRWDLLHPVECSIVVTPGKVEVFEISASHSKPFLADGDEIIHTESKLPLIAMDLTPLVPMRKSTAIDITIRSPPTAESRLKGGNNIMLRGRNPAECDQLYLMLNRSRINNPTYLALQNARGPYGQSSWAEAMDRQNAARSTSGSNGGWLAGTLGRKNSYRKTSTRAASISAATESSVGTMNTAFRSALGRFSFNRNSRFNIKSSTLGSRSTNSFDTGSSGSGSGTSTSLMIEPGRAPGAPAGITNTKCRLYERDSVTKWRDLGSARLTIMLPDHSAPQSIMRQGKGSPGTRNPMQEKRIVIVGKAKGATLLDVTLSESCFERVARSGIAVSVWEDIIGPDGQVGRAGITGGVSGARARVFMIQMKSERECAFSYSLLGKLRY